jgi:hypothetical protein
MLRFGVRWRGWPSTISQWIGNEGVEIHTELIVPSEAGEFQNSQLGLLMFLFQSRRMD